MNYYSARQADVFEGNKCVGKWCWTCKNGDAVWAIGACIGCSGHDTPEAARNHQKEHDISNAQFAKQRDKVQKCTLCETKTNRVALLGLGKMSMVPLRDNHSDKASLVIAYEMPAEITASL